MFAPSVFKVSGIFLFCEIHLLTNESLPLRQKLKKEHSPLIPFSYNIFTLPTGSSFSMIYPSELVCPFLHEPSANFNM